MKRNGIMAMEGLEEVIDAQPVETMIAENDAVAGQLETENDQVQEGEGIADTVDVIEENMQAAVDSGEGLSEEAAQITNAALEHFYQRLQYSGKRKPKISLEGYHSSNTRLANTKAALEELREFKPLLAKGLKVSQEGLGERFMRAISQITTTRDGILKELNAASARYDNSEQRTDLIDRPAFGATLNPENKDIADGSDAVKAMTSAHKSLFNPERIKGIAEATGYAVQIHEEIMDTRFVPSDKNISVIKELTEKINKALADTPEEVKKVREGNDKQTFKPLDSNNKKKIVDLANKLLNDKTAENALHALRKEISKVGLHADLFVVDPYLESRAGTRLIGAWAGDLRAARVALKLLRSAAAELTANYKHGFSIVHDAASYIKASISK